MFSLLLPSRYCGVPGVVGVPAVAFFPAIAGVLAVAGIPFDPSVPFYRCLFILYCTVFTVPVYKFYAIELWE
jgi:hypothetical protein